LGHDLFRLRPEPDDFDPVHCHAGPPQQRGGQSMVIALFKWLGTLAPTIQFYGQTGSHLVLIFGIGCFVYDVIYMGMLYLKSREMKLNPFTRKPVKQA
jgi:hypothetical protein